MLNGWIFTCILFTKNTSKPIYWKIPLELSMGAPKVRALVDRWALWAPCTTTSSRPFYELAVLNCVHSYNAVMPSLYLFIMYEIQANNTCPLCHQHLVVYYFHVFLHSCSRRTLGLDISVTFPCLTRAVPPFGSVSAFFPQIRQTWNIPKSDSDKITDKGRLQARALPTGSQPFLVCHYHCQLWEHTSCIQQWLERARGQVSRPTPMLTR